MSDNSSGSVNSYAPPTPEFQLPDSHSSTLFSPLHSRFSRSPILKEKSLNFDKVDQWGKNIVSAFGWRKFVSTPRGRINITIVREFYSALITTPIDEVSQTVLVRGVAVPFSSTIINNIFDIPSVDFLHFELNWGFDNPYNQPSKIHESFQYLFPHFHTNFEMSANALDSHLLAWKHFINSRVYPTDNFQNLTEPEMLLLYALLSGEYVDWGILIHRTVLEFAVAMGSRGKPMPSSWMISRLCVRLYGVRELDSDEIYPAPDNRVGLFPVEIPGCSSSN